MATYCIDTETYYDAECTVKLLGPWHYCRHPKWNCYMVSIAGDDGTIWAGPPEEAPWDKVFRPENTLLSHNTGFDYEVIVRLHELGVIPEPKYAVWEDTADLAAYLGVPRNLKAAAGLLLGMEMDKTVRDSMVGREFSELNEEERAEMTEYATQDAVASLALWQKFSEKWPEIERWASRHTRAMGQKGFPFEKSKLDAGVATLTEVVRKAGEAIPWFDPENEDSKPLSRNKLEAECAIHGITVPKSLAKDNPECIAWEDEHADHFPFIRAMRDFRRGNMLLQKLITVSRRMTDDGYAKFNFLYFGGHTGRWSGGSGEFKGGFNMQNVPKDELYGVNMRDMLIAPPGKKFVIVDLSQIEARITLWYARDLATLDLIRSGVDLYEAHARATMGYSDPKVLKYYDAENGTNIRQLAKARVLGLGFGCGDERFVEVAWKMSRLRISRADSERIVADYRRSNPKIVGLWGKLERHLKFHCGHDAPAEFELPSGRVVAYQNVRRIGGKLTCLSPQGGRFARKSLWGGVLTENLVQATARDILLYYIHRLETEFGVSIRLHVHDELVALVDADKAQDTLDTMLKVMSEPPPWMKTLPIAGEGTIADLYEKD